jgi:hypothetical protein
MATESELFRDLLRAPDRDRIPGATPILSYREDENEEFEKQLNEHAISRVDLSRRGVWHGRWAEIDEKALSEPDKEPNKESGEEPETEPDKRARWQASKPIVLRGILKDRFDQIYDSTELALSHCSEFKKPGELRRWIEDQLDATKPSAARFKTLDKGEGSEIKGGDPERDISRQRIQASLRAKDGTVEIFDDLWVKVSKLSTSNLDESIRVRFSFGNEVEDDSNPDPVRNRLIAELATRCLPAATRIRDCDNLNAVLEKVAERPLYPTQQIAYWNAPEGGALFHHDSFEKPGQEVEATQQLGVVYAQVSGRTAWLALSIADLAKRVREFMGHISDGQLHWVRADLYPGVEDFQNALDFVADEKKLIEELAKPGCGELASLVNRGPEFTAFLADCGHGCILRPGDAILLPNTNLHNTAMHSVFCASPDVTYGISCGVRATGTKPLSTEVVKRGKVIQPRPRRKKGPRKG